MGDSATHRIQPSVDLLTAAREWVWRHSSQPNGDPWDSDPEHLDWAAQRLVDELAQRLLATGSSASAAEQNPGRPPGPPRRRISGCRPLAEPPPPGGSEAAVDGAQPHLDARIDCVAAVPTRAELVS